MSPRESSIAFPGLPPRGGAGGDGGLEILAAATLPAVGLPVVVVNPAQVRSFADALGKRAKIDAEVIARYAAMTPGQAKAAG